MNFHRGEISTVKKINLKKAYKILQTHLKQLIYNVLSLSATLQLLLLNSQNNP